MSTEKVSQLSLVQLHSPNHISIYYNMEICISYTIMDLVNRLSQTNILQSRKQIDAC